MDNKKINSFEDLKVWKLGHELSLEIYSVTTKFPKNETYGLVSQIRRASVSIPANIVEGYYRNTTRELIQFLYHARGSCGEVIYFLVLTKDLGYIKTEDYNKLRNKYNILIKQITAFINSLKRK